MARRPTPPRLDLDTVIGDPTARIVVCCGSGGVGKTTTAAALALRAAEAGRTVVVLTIDPALRLAQALGLNHLDNTPRPVKGVDTPTGGSLDAMMLDMKRTFDEVVETHAPPEKAAQILENPFYQAVSSSFAGTQEYMAMEKLGQLRAMTVSEGGQEVPRWDLIVVDTPPSRSALDFLDAPKRLGSFLDGRLIRLLTAPARAGGRAYAKVFSAGMGIATSVMARVLGGDLLRDVQTFVAALDTMFGGFRERADQTYALLKDEETSFVVVASPDRDALREASFFVDRLEQEDMPLAGVVVNRVQQAAVPGISASRALDAARDLEQDHSTSTASTTAGLLHLHADIAVTAARHHAQARRFSSLNPGIPIIEVPAAAEDIHDLEGLREVGQALATSF